MKHPFYLKAVQARGYSGNTETLCLSQLWMNQPLNSGGVIALVFALAAGLMVISPQSLAEPVRPSLNQGVRLGDIVLVRRVEPQPMRVVDKHSGPIASRVNPRDEALRAGSQALGATAIALTDERAANVRGSINQHLTGSNSILVGAVGRSGSGSLSHGSGLGALGGGGGGGVAERVTSATSGISGSIGQALAPISAMGSNSP